MSGDDGETSTEFLRSIPGNAPDEAKELVQRYLYILRHGFGARTTKSLELVEVSLVPSGDEPARQEARVVLELTVTEEMLNSAGKMHGACSIHLVDMCTALPFAVLSPANGGPRSMGVSQNISAIFHAPASLGDRLRLINTSTGTGPRSWSARVEMWDVTHRRLAVSATQVRMEPSKL